MINANYFPPYNPDAGRSGSQARPGSRCNSHASPSTEQYYYPMPNSYMASRPERQSYASPQGYLSSVHTNQLTDYQKTLQSNSSGSVLAGYWFEQPPQVDLASIPGCYNIICVAFMQTGPNGIPTFSPSYMTDVEFRAAVETLKCQGREVLISLGGAFGYVALACGDRRAFVSELIRIVDKYGFTGFDIDLGGDSITAADNQTVIPEALMEVKNYYLQQNMNFIITMAPEFPNLRGADAPYRPYIQKLEGYYDLIFPQYYNQGSDGIWSYELNMFLPSDSNEHKAAFLYTLSNAIITGTQDYVQIPADKLAIGLPASPDAAFSGYVENPDDVQLALDRLDYEGNCIRGLMTWSINQDVNNGYGFVNSYAPIVFCRKPCAPQAPETPVCEIDLNAVLLLHNSIGLQWNSCDQTMEVAGYVIYRDNVEIARVDSSQTSFLDSGLSPYTEYAYAVNAFDYNGNYSEMSNQVLATTTSGPQSGCGNPCELSCGESPFTDQTRTNENSQDFWPRMW